MADEEVKKGDKIKVIYTGYLEDGSIFDSNEGKDALLFEVGAGQVIKGFDDAVVGMKVGGKKSITIKPEEAYGERHEEMVLKIPKTQFQPQHHQIPLLPVQHQLQIIMHLYLH